ncbi:MAG TPA: HDOD domain-containing protein [Deltaproteobacteria bacterium]|nr:HDOD domain-containing protein [Deltaproteobacteria bacterium]
MDVEYLPMQIEEHIDSIPTLESSRMRLFRVIQDQGANLEDVERIISTDPAIVAKVMKLANSSFYRHSSGPVGLQQSLLTIGLEMVKCIALSLAIIETFKSDAGLFKMLWRHSYAVALAGSSLVRSKQEREMLFTGGLLHDLGRMVLLCRMPQDYAPLYELENTWPDVGLEQEVLLTDHARIGGILARKWHFPEEIVHIIASHHLPKDRISALVCLTDLVVSRLERGFSPDVDEHAAMIFRFFPTEYKDLVNAVIQRYNTTTAIVENLG